jgi:hypothetical protein
MDLTEMQEMAVLRSGRAFASPAEIAAQERATGTHIVVLSICVATLAGAFLLRPAEDGLSLFGCRWPFCCWLHETLGIRCGLCGLSRSFCSLARGDIAAGLHFHRLGPAVFALFCLEIPYRLVALAAGSRGIDAKWARLHLSVVALVCAAILVNWMVYLGGLIL